MRHVLKNLTRHSHDKSRVVDDFLALEKEGSVLKDHYESMFKSIDIDAHGEVDIRELIHMLFKKCNSNEQQDIEDYILMEAKICGTFLGSFDRSAVSLSNLKIILSHLKRCKEASNPKISICACLPNDAHSMMEEK